VKLTCGDTLGRGCFRTLPVDRFYTKGKRADGSPRYHALCRSCYLDVQRDWHEENPEKKPRYNRTSYVRDADSHREKQRERYAAKRDEIRCRWRERYATDPDYRRQRLEANRERYATDPDVRRRKAEANRRYREKKRREADRAKS
jgi:hypothetical protein